MYLDLFTYIAFFCEYLCCITDYSAKKYQGTSLHNKIFEEMFHNTRLLQANNMI